MSRETKYWPFKGGLDVVTPPITISEGKMIACGNYEPWINGGYRRVKGYERFDGRPRPSDSTWDQICLVDLGAIALNDTVTGDSSGATGVVIGIDIPTSCIAVTKVVGTFTDSEDLNTSTYTMIGLATGEDSPDILTEQAWRLAAEDEYRGDIVAVPGLNAIRGFWEIKDRRFAFRDNAGQTACIPHKATATGWDDTAITMAEYLYFVDGGEGKFEEGDTIVGGTSGATADVHRVIVHRGAWGTTDANGYLVLTNVVGGPFTDTEDLEVSAVRIATASGIESTFSFPVGGKYQFISHNFFGGSATYRVYGVSGVGPAFEIDENDILSPILMDLTLGDSPDENKPFLIEEFDGRLWIAFEGGSVQRSVTGSPLVFNGFLGAAEFGLSEEVTGLTNTAGTVLTAFTRRQTHGFYRADQGGFRKEILSDRAGAIIYTNQELSTVYAVDDSGIIDLQRVDTFGDFADATISDKIQPIVVANKSRIAGSMVIRESNQVRILMTNGDGIIARMNPQGPAEFGLLSYPETVNVAYSCEDETGQPTNWFAGDSGFIYQAEVGRNWDGAAIESFARLPFGHQGGPANRKRYRLAELELSASRALTLTMAQEMSYGSTETGAWSWSDAIIGGGGFYDIENWDEIYYDSQVISTARFELLGTGENLSLLFYNNSAVADPFVLQGCILHYDPRRVQR